MPHPDQADAFVDQFIVTTDRRAAVGFPTTDPAIATRSAATHRT
jgi:hypothetical protein